jgi:hypothetical protein
VALDAESDGKSTVGAGTFAAMAASTRDPNWAMVEASGTSLRA